MSILRKTLVLVFAMTVLFGTANADTYQIWYGTSDAGVTDTAVQGVLPGLSTTLQPNITYVTFNYTGPISFDNPNGQGGTNTFQLFFGPSFTTASMSGFQSSDGTTAANFLLAPMSTVGETGQAINTYMDITGTYYGPVGTVSVTHDDGAVLYLNGTPCFSSGTPTSARQDGCTNNDATGTFDLSYVESNGAPSVLIANLSDVPEPASLILFGSGMLGLVGVAVVASCAKAGSSERRGE